MITAGKIADYMYARSKQLGIAEIYQWGNIPAGVVNKPRVTIQAKSQNDGMRWISSFVEVNICYPYLNKTGIAPLNELDKAEQKARALFHGIVENIDDDWVEFSVESMSRYKDDALQCYYVNAHIRFNVLNINV